jgi:diguanylate cyclase (GGDEF)-like protein
MPFQTGLIVVLAVLVVVLSVLLAIRLRREKRQTVALKGMDLADFSEFLRTNSVEGTIQAVAGRVSEFLKGTFGCEKIVFLRKQRGMLELNYYHGIRGFKRHDFRLRYSRELGMRLQEDFLPKPLTALRDVLPRQLYGRMTQLGVDTYFPIFWRENLYGVYFVRSNVQIRSRSFTLLVGGLAQSLAAAYHIKWHESRYQRLERKIQSESAPKRALDNGNRQPLGMLKLIRHHNSDSIVPRIMESVQQELGLAQVAFIYESKQRDGSLILWKHGLRGSLEAPERALFNELCKEVGQTGTKAVGDLANEGSRALSWVRVLKDIGLTHVVKFPLTSKRTGLLAWSGGESPGRTARMLSDYHFHTRSLVENAESYEHIEEMSYTDNLTGLANQRYFRKRLAEEISRAKRYRRSVALIIFDLDDLKKVNDGHGHLAGDAVLRRLGQILRSSIRAIDIIARYGGDEFCVIMPESDESSCSQFMERLRTTVAGHEFKGRFTAKTHEILISAGGAIFPENARRSDRLIYCADMALLEAKKAGRNRCRMYSQLDLNREGA